MISYFHICFLWREAGRMHRLHTRPSPCWSTSWPSRWCDRKHIACWNSALPRNNPSKEEFSGSEDTSHTACISWRGSSCRSSSHCRQLSDCSSNSYRQLQESRYQTRLVISPWLLFLYLLSLYCFLFVAGICVCCIATCEELGYVWIYRGMKLFLHLFLFY